MPRSILVNLEAEKMNDLTTLDLSPPVKPSLPIGIDVTMLLAASSFIGSPGDMTDPRAKESFTSVATAYCDGSPLLLPLPINRVGRAPLFYCLWKESGAFTSIPGVELSDEAFNRLIKQGRADDFEKNADAFPEDFSRWIAFQFTSELSHAHVDRADPWVQLRCQPIVARMIEEKRFPKLRAKIGALVKKGQLGCPAVYRDLLPDTFPDLPHLCIAYAMSVVLRGFSYAVAIGSREDSTPPLYCHHWVRDRIVRTFEENGIKCNKSVKVLSQFPWGTILSRVFDPKRPLEPRDPSKVGEVLTGIREQSSEISDSLEEGLLSEVGDGLEHDRLSDAEVQVAHWLKASGVILRRKNDVTSLLGSCLKDVGSVALGEAVEQIDSPTPAPAILLGLSAAAVGLGTLVEKVTTVRPSSFMRSLDYKVHVRFFRNSFWRVMEDPSIREALRIVAVEK